MRYVLSADLGSEQDYTAFSITERVEKVQDKNIQSYNSRPIRNEPIRIVSEMHLTYMERVPLQTPYPIIVDKLKYIMCRPEFVGDIILVVDRTGVGIPVTQMMFQAGLAPIGITIHGGDAVNAKEQGYNVPKRDIVTALLTAFQMKRYKMPPPSKMPIIKKFEEELTGFRMKVNQKTGHDSYEAWMEKIHDDLVISAAMAVWWFDKTHGITTLKEINPG
jgi:hypothetical protein